MKKGESSYTEKSYVLDGAGQNYNNFFIQKNNSYSINSSSEMAINVSNSSSNKAIIIHLVGASKFDKDSIEISMRINKI